MLEIRLYQMPNLVESASVITDYQSYGAFYDPVNLVTNLE